MTVNTDSIQTLLKQRRELRDCLRELRDEISTLNLKADTIVSKVEKDASGSGKGNLFGDYVPQQGRGEPCLDQNAAPSNGLSALENQAAIKTPIGGEAAHAAQSTNEAVPKSSLKSEIENSDKKTIDHQEPIMPLPSASYRDIKELDVEETQQATETKIEEKAPSQIPSMEIMKEFDTIDDESLYCRAKLLSDYFSNHPSPVANEVLVRLDKAIKSLNQIDATLDKKKDVAHLREVYREVSSRSYEKFGINGETLVDSRGGIGILWGVPLFIAGLVLVLFPLILLLRSLGMRMLVADFAADLSYILTASTGFLWGCVGALSYIAWGVGVRAKKGSYRKGSSKGLALRAALGGVFGIVVFLCITPFMPLEGILPDMGIGLISFFIGLFSSVLFVILYRMITGISAKVN